MRCGSISRRCSPAAMKNGSASTISRSLLVAVGRVPERVEAIGRRPRDGPRPGPIVCPKAVIPRVRPASMSGCHGKRTVRCLFRDIARQDRPAACRKPAEIAEAERLALHLAQAMTIARLSRGRAALNRDRRREARPCRTLHPGIPMAASRSISPAGPPRPPGTDCPPARRLGLDEAL